MARRRKDGIAEDIVEIVARLPWWAGVVLALVSYVVLHRLAVAPKTVTHPGQLSQVVVQTWVGGLALAGQFILPALCLIAALVSFLRRRKRQTLVSGVANARTADALHGMSWKEFEMLVGEAFRLQGYAVTEIGGGGADGGVDLVLRKGSEVSLVQCKQWKATQVGVQVVRELFGVMAARGAAQGFVVTSGSFTADARSFADGRNIKLVDGAKLFGLVQQARRSFQAGRPAVAPSSEQVPQVPECPKCRAPMVRRTAQKGSNPGSKFWGCSAFPKCRGARQDA
jgi:restriction system protein